MNGPSSFVASSGTRRGAIVTGASRGIGKATSIALAEHGYDVAITARTVRRTDRTMHPTMDQPLPGSLEETAEAIERAGASAYPVALDLLDESRIAPAAEQAIGSLDRIDVLVNNAIFTAGGNDQRFLDADLDLIDKRVFANVTAQLRFSQPVVAAMVRDGGGVILNLTSGAAYAPPFAQPGAGGWGMGYAVSKAGFHRFARQLAFEYADEGIVALNIQPGFVATERTKMSTNSAASANVARIGIAPEVIGRTIAHIATNAADFDPARTVQLQDVAVQLGLLDKPAAL